LLKRAALPVLAQLQALPADVLLQARHALQARQALQARRARQAAPEQRVRPAASVRQVAQLLESAEPGLRQAASAPLSPLPPWPLSRLGLSLQPPLPRQRSLSDVDELFARHLPESSSSASSFPLRRIRARGR
jgi:hypothetical protein